MKIIDWVKKKKERRRKVNLEKEWKPLRRQYAGMIYAALLCKERGFGRYQDAPTTEAMVLADELIKALMRDEQYAIQVWER